MSEPAMLPDTAEGLLGAIVAQAIEVQSSANITGPAPVYVSSIAADGTPIVTAADADVPGALATHVLVASAFLGDAKQYAFKRTTVKAFDTHLASVGAPVYLSATPGTFSLTAPVTGRVQIVGRVTVVGTLDGEFVADLSTPLAGGEQIETVQQAFIVGGAAGNLTVTGIATADRLISVLSQDDTSGVFVNLTAEFTITAANTINNGGGTSTAAHHVLVTYGRRP